MAVDENKVQSLGLTLMKFISMIQISMMKCMLRPVEARQISGLGRCVIGILNGT